MPATPTSWPPSVVNVPASAVSVSSAGAAHVPKRRDHPGSHTGRCLKALIYFANRKCTMAMVSVGSIWG